MSSVEAPIRDATGLEVGKLIVSSLPRRQDAPSLVSERIVVAEEGTYVFQIVVAPSFGDVELNPREELFSFDDASNTRGRLLPRQHVGRVRVQVEGEAQTGSVTLSIEPRKLEAETEYRQMLDGIAEIATEAILQGFAPAAVALEHDAQTDPKLLYQQFAFLHARLMGSGEHDLAMICHRPHTAWLDQDQLRPPGAPMRGGSRNLRALTKPGPRVRVPPSYGIPSLPQRVSSARTEETLDTEPNRFVLFALRRWRGLAQQVLDTLSALPRGGGPVSRGMDAAEEVLEMIDQTLTTPVFRDVGRLRSFPSGNQVLQKRAGYRDLLRTFVLTETGARLALDWDLDDVFGASQRNVATLYEYWAFLQLARSVGRVCGRDLSADVLQPAGDGLSLGFRRGNHSPLRWAPSARGRVLDVELYFNREFRVSAQPDASWSRAMRPDCSLRVRPHGTTGEVSDEDLQVWLHFDAKYKVDFVDEQFAQPSDADGQEAIEAERVERVSRSKREDLLKMHAYRDAIKRSAGAYVLYPGQQHKAPFTEHHEVLPGLGAFVLRPTSVGAAGSDDLDTFLVDVLDHVADRASQHERSRFWRAIIHRHPPVSARSDRRLPALPRPPSDSPVLCGYVRSADHRAWIEASALYNVRAGDRRGSVSPEAEMLQAPDLVLYGADIRPSLWSREGPWFVQSREDLIRLEYPTPRGSVYLCCPIQRREDEPEWLLFVELLEIASGRVTAAGAPFATTWQELLELSGDPPPATSSSRP